MAKYLNLGEVDSNKMPTDPKERAAVIGKAMEMTKKMLSEGQITDWGIFAGGGAGYAIGEGSETELYKHTMQFGPYYKFHIHPVLSIDEVDEVMKSLMG